jgi:hypothetical protein
MSDDFICNVNGKSTCQFSKIIAIVLGISIPILGGWVKFINNRVDKLESFNGRVVKIETNLEQMSQDLSLIRNYILTEGLKKQQGKN